MAAPPLAHRAAAIPLLAAVIAMPAAAGASTIAPLAPAQLHAGAELVIEGEVLAVQSRWTADRHGLETEIRVRIDRVLQGTAPGTELVIRQPGGELDGARQWIVGLPQFAVGDRARLFLRHNRNDPTSYRVYGWHQGRWPVRTLLGRELYLPESRLAADQPVPPNGLVWRPEQLPVTYLVNSAGSDDLTYDQLLPAITSAFAAWQQVPCSALAFQFDGPTELGVAVDDFQVITFIESNWLYGTEAAAATALSILPETPPTADVAFNGENFTWAIGPAAAEVPDTQDLQAVLTHELGHFSGLTHSLSSVDTMYFSWRPWQSQRSLSAGDKLGLCAVYPQAGDECSGGDCPDGDSCESYDAGALCTTGADPLGAPCNREQIECEHFCLFTSASLTAGYCSMFCDEQPCPAGFDCQAASAGTQTVMVCRPGSPTPDAGPTSPDAGPTPECIELTDCPGGQFCTDSGVCTYQCIQDFDCDSSELSCNSHGQCIAAVDGDGSGCGCSTSSDSHLVTWLLGLGLVVAWRHRRR